MISTRPPFALSLSKGDLGLFTSASIKDDKYRDLPEGRTLDVIAQELEKKVAQLK